MSKFTVIRDTREKKGHGWWFDDNAYCEGTVVQKVDIGDYTIQDMEHLLCIERKESAAEFAKNCGEKRFHRELERMVSFRYPFLLLEFGWHEIENYPRGSSIPTAKWKSLRIKGNYMMRVISTARLQYGVHVIACGDKKRAEATAFTIMRKVYELHI